ncbi:flavin-containing monooxygenase [Sphingopyxis sp. 113P3]|uniref:flavin-containing monooxygenase n=1 Tax=Sphingopyxis sp. (strain 113P3) TaxID=292913 RepID=UPI0006AD1F0B|nr:NAD(P)/FAD-dependent oxidoreductase [Sphingopyxis sp. 113P3]ALC14163.1 cyclohexanone monooxygenase [Sphingopyxis sp. 113P3]
MSSKDVHDVVVVGAGFAGLYAVHKLRGQGLCVQAFERGDDVGGTWYWNRYPGARCDIESMEYSYSFSEELQQEWEWKEKFAGQSEILAYLRHVAERFDLRRSYRFGVSVVSAIYDAQSECWSVVTDEGSACTTRYLVLAVGCLSNAMRPQIAGMERFEGRVLHTGNWPHEGVDFTGERVGIVGTGSSGVQAIPMIAQQAADLTVFQRTATYTVPARNAPLDPAEVARVKSNYADFRRRNRKMIGARGADRLQHNPKSVFEATPEERRDAFLARWAEGGMGIQATYHDLRTNLEANAIVADFVREQIRDIVKDPATAELLCPKQPLGCKRMCIDTNYYATFNLPNVHLVDVKSDPISHLTVHGLVAGDTEYRLDSLVFATGFDAMTGALLAIDIRGRDGLSLREAWTAGPRTYLGVSTVGFPNMFVLVGPGSPSVLANVVIAAEQHVEWVTDLIVHLDRRGARAIEPQQQAQDDWVDHVNAVAAGTLYTSCDSWYLGANVPGKARVFMPLFGFPAYEAKCNAVAADGYVGFDVR